VIELIDLACIAFWQRWVADPLQDRGITLLAQFCSWNWIAALAWFSFMLGLAVKNDNWGVMTVSAINIILPLIEALWPTQPREKRLTAREDGTGNPGLPGGVLLRLAWGGLVVFTVPGILFAPHRWVDLGFFYFPARWFACLTDACQPRPPRPKRVAVLRAVEA